MEKQRPKNNNLNIEELFNKNKDINFKVNEYLDLISNHNLQKSVNEYLKELNGLKEEFYKNKNQIKEMLENTKNAKKNTITIDVLLILFIIICCVVFSSLHAIFVGPLLFAVIGLVLNHSRLKKLETNNITERAINNSNEILSINLDKCIKMLNLKKTSENNNEQEIDVNQKKLDIANMIIDIYCNTGILVDMSMEMKVVITNLIKETINTNEMDLNVLLNMAKSKFETENLEKGEILTRNNPNNKE